MAKHTQGKASSKKGKRPTKPEVKGTLDNSKPLDQTSQQTQPPCPTRWEQLQRWFETKKRTVWWFGGILVLLGIALGAIGFLADVGPAFDVLKHLIPSPKPPPFTTPAVEGEYLIILADFVDESAARNLDVPTVLAAGIEAVLPPESNTRVAIAQGIFPNDRENAQKIGERYGATLIVWGRYTDNLIELSFTPLINLAIPTEHHEVLFVKRTVDDLSIFVNDLAGGAVRWLSLLTIGQALSWTDHSSTAIDCFNAVLDPLATAGPDKSQRAGIYLLRALAYLELGDSDSANADLSYAITHSVDDTTKSRCYSARGHSHWLDGDLSLAIADYDQAIALDSNNVEAYLNRASVQIAMGDPVAAIADYDKAIELDPGFAGAYSHRGLAHSLAGNLGRAIADFNRAIKLDAQYAHAYAHRGIVRADMGDYKGALDDYSASIRLYPEDDRRADAYFNRGIAHAYLGDYADAIADHSEAIRLYADGDLKADAYLYRGIARADMEDYEGALADYSEAIRLYPEDDRKAYAYFNRGITHAQREEFTDAIADLVHATDLDPNFDYAYWQLAYCYAQVSNPKGACDSLAKAIELDDRYQELSRTDIGFAPIRNEPCYQALVASP